MEHVAQANSVNFYGNIYYILGILVRINMFYLLSAEFGGTMGLCLGAYSAISLLCCSKNGSCQLKINNSKRLYSKIVQQMQIIVVSL